MMLHKSVDLQPGSQVYRSWVENEKTHLTGPFTIMKRWSYQRGCFRVDLGMPNIQIALSKIDDVVHRNISGHQLLPVEWIKTDDGTDWK